MLVRITFIFASLRYIPPTNTGEEKSSMAERVYGHVMIVEILYWKTVSGEERGYPNKISGAYKRYCWSTCLFCRTANFFGS